MQKGYRVGGQCFATSEEASNYHMSMVVPTITADGTLKMPTYQNNKWYYANQPINLTFPECDPLSSFNDGLKIGTELSILFAIVFAFKLAIRLFQKSSEPTEEK